jgi:dimethylargininase
MRLPRRALVRPPPDSYAHALTRDADPRPVDVTLARQQHAVYTAALRRINLAVTELPPDPEYPDSCFVQDPAFVLDDILVVARPGAQSRRHEGRALAAALAPLEFPKYNVVPPAALEGGDVLFTEDKLFVGLSARTNGEAVEQLRMVFARPVVAVPVPERYLHLLTGCTYLGNGRLLATAECAALPELSGFERLLVPESEAPAANVLALGAEVILPDGYPLTAELLARTGFKLHPVPIGEFEKRDGGVTCLSLLY